MEAVKWETKYNKQVNLKAGYLERPIQYINYLWRWKRKKKMRPAIPLWHGRELKAYHTKLVYKCS